ncbi:DUF4407 domain-containing protein [Nocardia otitidiscaviarum]|uniref:DUF4407 domain-containing protein n=1 Tax=Nocardia otitidiscaviarum TaxID=1823 RepID=UPI001895C47B|nr:DUF4407 domain-containing protein [Nocardia otitidiscaviarum]MBF6237980.1 DUF4407 domain-containing protein [Nocardia otitidiscaviarum]
MTAPHVPEPHVPADEGGSTPSSTPPARRSPGPSDPTAGVRALLTWLGGGDSRLTDRHELSGYALTGAVVALFAGVAGAVTALATGAAGWPIVGIVLIALFATLLAGAVGRAMATVPAPARGETRRSRAEFAGRVAVAVLAGVMVAELASTVLFGGTVDRLLDDRARTETESVATVVTARDELGRARTDRTALDQQIAQAKSDVDTALLIARCEFDPEPAACPQELITSVPGRGPEERTANEMLDDARARLTAAEERIAGLDARVSDREQALADARDAAYTDGDRGLGARWVAMNDHTTAHGGALTLRLATIVLMVLLALLPLLLRWWRGETSFDRRVAFRADTDRAAQEAETAIAVGRARTRVEIEKLHAEQAITAARLTAHADTAINREQQRKRIIAAIGGLEIGITESGRRAVNEFDRAALDDAPAHELPAATAGDRKDSSVSQEGIVTPSNLPAQIAPGALAPAAAGGALAPAGAAPRPEQAKPGGGLELPIIGTVPFTDTAARWIRPLVPSFVANAIDTATHPLRTVRQAFEEAEEITFTLRRTRKVTVDSEDSAQPQQPGYQLQQPGYQLPPGAQQQYAHHVASTVVDQPYAQYPGYAPGYTALPGGQAAHGYGLPPAPQQTELSARQHPALEYRGPRELPPGKDE